MDITHETVPQQEAALYRLTGVSKIYRKGGRDIPAVRDVDLEIRAGEWLAVQGKTGHGKTTLLHLLGGLDRPTRGRLDFGGTDLAQNYDPNRYPRTLALLRGSLVLFSQSCPLIAQDDAIVDAYGQAFARVWHQRKAIAAEWPAMASARTVRAPS